MGPEGDPAVLGSLPEHVHVEGFVAQDRVLPLVDAVNHHGGTGTLLAAFAQGLPQVLVPQGANQFQNAEVFARTGAEVIMPPRLATGALLKSLEAVLFDASMRTAAQAIKLEIEEMPAPRDVMPLLERLP